MEANATPFSPRSSFRRRVNEEATLTLQLKKEAKTHVKKIKIKKKKDFFFSNFLSSFHGFKLRFENKKE